MPQLDFAAWDAPRRVVKEEEPFHCIRCGKPFGTKSTIERVVRQARRQALDVLRRAPGGARS